MIVQIRDSGLQDAPAIVLGEGRGVVQLHGASLATLEISMNPSSRALTVWAHVDADNDGRVSKGDYVTSRSYPLPRDPDPRLPITVVRVQ